MATRSTIGIENDDETVTYIYCHWDGYPEHNGKILLEHYKNEDKVRDLMRFGSLSILSKEIGDLNRSPHDSFLRKKDGICLAYGRDRGEDCTEAKTCKPGEIQGEEFNYLFKDGKWYVRGWDIEEFQDLESVLKNNKD